MKVLLLLISSLAFSITGLVFAQTPATQTPGTGAPASQSPLSILLIYVDDIGYGDLGCFGSSTETPNIHQLAADGARFPNYLTGI